MWRGHQVNISFVLIVFDKMSVFSQMLFLNDFFEKPKGKAYMGESHELKTVEILYEIDNFSFLFIYVFFSFFEKV